MIWESNCHPVNFHDLQGHLVYLDPWAPQILRSLKKEKQTPHSFIVKQYNIIKEKKN